MLFDPTTGEALRTESAAYNHEVCTAGGITGLHDARAVVAETIRLGRLVCENIQTGGIEAIAVCGTYHSVMVCDTTMSPVTPAYTWMYDGASALCVRLRQSESFTRGYYHRTGCMVHALYPAFQLMDLHEKEFCFQNTRIATVSGFLFYNLTGVHLETAATNSGGGLINLQTRAWDDATIEMAGLTPENLAPLAGYRDTCPLSSAGAALLGLQAGIPVLPSHPDGALNQVGSGALRPGIMTFSMGTSAAIRLSVPAPLTPEEPAVWCYLSPTGWLSGAAVNGACNCVDWIKPLLFPQLSYAEIEREAVRYQDMPYFLPFLFGERCPGWNDARKGGFLAARGTHTALDFYYSVLEGILFNIYQCYTILRGIAGEPAAIQLSGGIVNSKRWTQMCADIFGQELCCAKIPHASLMGGAVLAMEVTGHIKNIADYQVAAKSRVPPNPESQAIFAARYQKYLEFYGTH